MTKPAITNLDEGRLVTLIGSAQHRIIYLAPGVSEKVATALSAAWRALGAQAVVVVLDVDPEICRLGYGTREGLEQLHTAASKLGTMVCHQPGVRIGVLIVDETTLVYSPAAQLIEQGSSNPRHPNAVQLGSVPEEVARDVGLNSAEERKIGLDPVKSEKIAAVRADFRRQSAIEV